MAKSKPADAQVTAIAQAMQAAAPRVSLIDALHAQTAASITEVTGLKLVVETALNATTAAKVGKLGTMRNLWPNVSEPITADTFDAQCRPTMLADYTASNAFKSKGVIGALISLEKVAIIALSHGTHMGASLMPEAGESLTPYVKRVRLLMMKSDSNTPALWLQTTNKVSDTADEATETESAATDAAKGTPRERALRLLCNGNLADMQMLDILTASNMGQLRITYAMLYPIKTK